MSLIVNVKGMLLWGSFLYGKVMDMEEDMKWL